MHSIIVRSTEVYICIDHMICTESQKFKNKVQYHSVHQRLIVNFALLPTVYRNKKAINSGIFRENTNNTAITKVYK